MSSDKERVGPWLAEGAITLVNSFINSFRQSGAKPNMLETGMGSSTTWFYYCTNLVSIEHDYDWFDKVGEKIQANHIDHAAPLFEQKLVLHERPYNKCIEEQSDDHFHLILIDGRDRVKCIESAIPKLKKSGWLILDNSERPYYQKGIELMSTWNRMDFHQVQPDKYGFTYPGWKTSIFIKP